MRSPLKYLLPSACISLLLFTSSSFAGGCPEGQVGKNPLPPATKASGKLYIHQQAQMQLGEQTINADGWRFRSRTLTFAPGTVVPLHSHENRPETAEMKVGQVRVYESNCKVPYTMAQGEVFQSGKGDSHWVINESDSIAVMSVVDLVKTDSFPTQ